MFKRKSLIIALGALYTLPSYASMNIQPDPENPAGYVVDRSEIQVMEQQKTSDPMYAIWSKALETIPK
ncbi:hypothetical protein FOF44_14865 [Vibrio algivorus]|uniref:Uncharacterized protein n=1 Tax=Vibrio algivorus TaxID=1667024 RepID=A0A557NYT8_9VIBR|nr:hypothetical protein [Vibrio algivorus]TVO33574.1 hypothetical protein FOF44_14865 [Vibrio algivorus]